MLSALGPIVFVVALLGVVYIVLRKEKPELAAKIAAAVLAGLAAAGAWLGGLFHHIAGS